jgi:hypothetical protein
MAQQVVLVIQAHLRLPLVQTLVMVAVVALGNEVQAQVQQEALVEQEYQVAVAAEPNLL